MPQTVRSQGPFGEFSVQWTRHSTAAVVETKLILAVDQVEPDQYGAFRDFMQRFDAAVTAPLVLEPESATP